MGPLSGFRIVEIAGIGPGQFCGMLLADMGAQLIRLERPIVVDLGIAMPARFDLMNRSRPTIAVDLKHPGGVELVLTLCEKADALFEGFRPGVMERFGLGPQTCMARNERLVYGRMTGWGQSGPLASSVGHDTNYIALSGALHSVGETGRRPPIPLNLIGDLGGGGAFLAIGILAALLEATRSGNGQIVDAAMVDGSASMLTMYYGLMAGGMWSEQRGTNLLDGGAPFVQVYATSDDKFVAVCAIETRFFEALLDGLGIHDINPGDQYNREMWPQRKKHFEGVFVTKTQDEWCRIFEGTDACVAPVLSMSEAPKHPHNKARANFVDVDGITQPAPAPRFSRTISEIRSAPTEPGAESVLAKWGLTAAQVARLRVEGVLGGSEE